MHAEVDMWRCDAREDMFARALLLKDRPEPAGSEADIKSDVEAVSSESDGSDEHEDPNEYLEDLPAGVRAAELEGGVLPKKDDNTRSAENPSRAQERETRKEQRGKRSPKQPARDSNSPEEAERESARAPLADVAKRSRGRAAGANDSAMHIRQESPFASFSEQAGAKDPTNHRRGTALSGTLKPSLWTDTSRLLDTIGIVLWGYALHVIAGTDQGIVRKASE